jgi:hypothetical protein
MSLIKKTALAGCILALASFSTAQAGVINGTFNIAVYQGVGDGTISDPVEQANKANILLNTTAFATLTYTGPIDFHEGPGGSLLISDFLTSGGGSYSILTGSVAGLSLSAATFGLTTLFDITWSDPASSKGGTGTISHDDGATLYQDGISVMDSAPPTVDISTPYTFVNDKPNLELIYVEANGLPARLNMVPEPVSISLLGMGMVGTGVVARRRRRSQTASKAC